MKIEGCEFPDDLLYDSDGLVWLRPSDSREVVAGITSIYAAVVGRPTKVTAKPLGAEYARGAAIGFLESGKYFGPIRSPVRGVLTATNERILAEPRQMTEAVYGEGWFARLRPLNLPEDQGRLVRLPGARETFSRQIAALRVRCFAAFPDHEVFEIGTECAAVLVKLDDLLARSQIGEVVHLVTDDPTAPIEMVRWSDQTGQPVIDERREGSLLHFLVRKIQ
jgi:glycine cleavage system H protein